MVVVVETAVVLILLETILVEVELAPWGMQNPSSQVGWVSGPSLAARTTLEHYNPLVAVSAEAYGFDEDVHQDSFLGLEIASEE